MNGPILTKRCTKCGETKAVWEFHTDKRYRTGLTSFL
jgi:hypothetical protein